MKRMYAAAIKPDDTVEDVFRVVEARLAPYRDASKGQYLHLLLADRSGEVAARLWDGAEHHTVWPAAGDVVRISGRATLYRDHIRLRVGHIRPATEDEWSPTELLAAPDSSEALATIHESLRRITQPELRHLLDSFFGDGQFMELLLLAPAHQPGRLVERSAALLELAEPLRTLADDFNHDLLATAILLHATGYTTALHGATAARSLSWLGVAQLSDDLISERLAQMPDFPAALSLHLRDAVRYAHHPEAGHTSEARALAALIGLYEVLTFKPTS
ncbi:MAG: hypothetical protein ABTQ73_04775 [Caldilineales bacterium]